MRNQLVWKLQPSFPPLSILRILFAKVSRKLPLTNTLRLTGVNQPPNRRTYFRSSLGVEQHYVCVHRPMLSVLVDFDSSDLLGKFETRDFCTLSSCGTPLYDHPVNTTTPLLRPHFCGPNKSALIFLSENPVKPTTSGSPESLFSLQNYPVNTTSQNVWWGCGMKTDTIRQTITHY